MIKLPDLPEGHRWKYKGTMYGAKLILQKKGRLWWFDIGSRSVYADIWGDEQEAIDHAAKDCLDTMRRKAVSPNYGIYYPTMMEER